MTGSGGDEAETVGACACEEPEAAVVELTDALAGAPVTGVVAAEFVPVLPLDGGDWPS